ncbi:MAG: DUF6273 domain-containing protein [Oscillospiraceae bacterium]|jgi:hypothetical protein|nr:DUF6273 domain-containing protein [Oscillospiraceae bacterium]
MRRNVYIKSTMRTPLRTLLLLLLIGAVSFAFISRLVEYVVVWNETDRLSESYRSIGKLEANAPELYDVSECAAIIAESQYTAFGDSRREYSGAIEGIYNADISGATNLSYPERLAMMSVQTEDMIAYLKEHPVNVCDVFMYAELVSKSYIEKEYRIDLPGSVGREHCWRMEFIVQEVETGYPEYASEGDRLEVFFWPMYWDGTETQTEEMEKIEEGSRYFIRAYYSLWGSHETRLRPLTDGGPMYLKVAPGNNLDFGSPELLELYNDLDLARESQHSMYVTATKDMSAMEDTQEASRNFYLADGRWIDYSDNLAGNRACVVNLDFAETRGLALGDKIKLTLRSPYDISTWGGYIWDKRDRADWRSYPTLDAEFEIVGTYKVPANANDYLVNYMYIPDSCIPPEFGGVSIYFNSALKYSFALKSSKDQEAFLAENKDALAALGFNATFLENGFETFWASATQIRRTTALNAAVFGLVAVMALALSAFLYVRMHRKEFAIQRALGTPAGSAVRKMLAPIAMIGVVAVTTGGLLSWGYTLGKAAETLAAVDVRASISSGEIREPDRNSDTSPPAATGSSPSATPSGDSGSPAPMPVADDATPSAETADKPSLQTEAGDIVRFGGYDWQVLEVRDGKALLISDKILTKQKYHSEATGITWEECDLRAYLNGPFYDSAFADEEKALIAETIVENNGSPIYGTAGGNDTVDKLFLLSLEELMLYFWDWNSSDVSGVLEAAAGQYAASGRKSPLTYIDNYRRMARYADTGLPWWWWLRTPGENINEAAYVNDMGMTYPHTEVRDAFGFYFGEYTLSDDGGVRPALWLNLQ